MSFYAVRMQFVLCAGQAVLAFSSGSIDVSPDAKWRSEKA